MVRITKYEKAEAVQNILEIYNTVGVHKFLKKSRNHFNVLGARKQTWRKLHTVDPKFSWLGDLATASCAPRP